MQGYNLFTYCGNNPVNRIDTSGADSAQIDDGEQELDETATTGCTPSGDFRNIIAGITEQLKVCASIANASIAGNGPIVGTYKHTAFANEVNQLGNTNLVTEVSYVNGTQKPYGTSGSIRFDVALVDVNGYPIAAWDLKTGTATLSPTRIAQMQSRSGLYIPIYLVR